MVSILCQNGAGASFVVSLKVNYGKVRSKKVKALESRLTSVLERRRVNVSWAVKSTAAQSNEHSAKKSFVLACSVSWLSHKANAADVSIRAMLSRSVPPSLNCDATLYVQANCFAGRESSMI